MEVRTSLKLIMEKGPREGETLEYPPGSLVKVGRVVRGNTIAIKDSGISSKHMSIQYDNQLSKWTLCDLDSSNGTVLNGQILEPFVPSALNDGDRIKIGELTSIAVKNEVESTARPKRNLRRQGKSGTGAEPDAVDDKGKTELGLGFDGDLVKNEVEQPVTKRNLRSGAKKDVDSRNEVESSSSKRILRSSKKEVSFVPTLNQIPENLNVDVTVIVDLSAQVEPKKTRGRRKKMPEQLPVDPDLDKRKSATMAVPVVGRVTRGRRKGLPVESLENVQSRALEENLNNANESLQIVEANEPTFDKLSVDRSEKVNDSGLGENLDAIESAQQHAVETLVSNQEYMKDGRDKVKRLDLERMTLGDFLDYLEVQLPKEIYEKSQKIISDLEEKARKYREFRLHRNESGKSKLVID